jgi:hypothetical protein
LEYTSVGWQHRTGGLAQQVIVSSGMPLVVVVLVCDASAVTPNK